MRHFNFAEEMPGSYEWYFIADTHLGNRAFREKPCKRCIADVKARKHTFVSFGGDMFDAITPDDKRFAIDSADPKMMRASMQIDAVVELFSPIASKVKYVMLGNHEATLMHVINGAELIAKGLGVYYQFPDTDEPVPADGTYTTICELGAARIFEWHGSGACSSRAGDLHQREMTEAIWVKRKMRDLASDCDGMVMHHIHKMRIHPPIERLLITSGNEGSLQSSYSKPTRIPIASRKGGNAKPDSWWIPEEDRWYASSGSFLGGLAEGFSPYTERFGYSPTDMGAVKMIVKNDKLIKFEKATYN